CVRFAVGKRLRFLHRLLNQPACAAETASRRESFATSHRGPWKYEAYTEREEAERREKFLKSGGRAAFETRSFPTLPRCFPRSFTFYVAHPVRSIPARPITSRPQFAMARTPSPAREARALSRFCRPTR